MNLWRVVSFLDRLIFCQHVEAPLQLDDDGSLWRVCSKCRHRFFVAAKANVIPMSRPSNVTSLARGKRA